MKLLLAIAAALALCQLALATWVNQYDQELNFECPRGEHVYKIESQHSNKKEDRQWKFECREGFVSHECEWTNHVNNFDQDLGFNCPHDGIITGLGSFHSNKQEDRRWKFRCCKLITKKGSSCTETGYINDWDSRMSHSMERGTAIRGFFSTHSNRKEDRRWKIRYCRFSTCQAQSMKILTQVNPSSDKMRLVGIASSQGCSSGATLNLQLSSTDSVDETYSISDTKGKSFTFGTEISVTGEGSVKFLGTGGSVSVGVSTSFGYTNEYSKTTTKETSHGSSATAGNELSYTGPGAGIIIAAVQQYKFNRNNVDVEYDIKCEDGSRYKKRSKVSLTAETYGRTHFMTRHAVFNPQKCTTATNDCINSIRGENALTPNKVLKEFENCIRGKGRVAK